MKRIPEGKGWHGFLFTLGFISWLVALYLWDKYGWNCAMNFFVVYAIVYLIIYLLLLEDTKGIYRKKQPKNKDDDEEVDED